MYQKINSSIVSEGAMNNFKEMFPLARMFPPAVIHTPSPQIWHILNVSTYFKVLSPPSPNLNILFGFLAPSLLKPPAIRGRRVYWIGY